MYHFWCDAGAVGNIAKLVLKNAQQVSYFYLNSGVVKQGFLGGFLVENP